MRPVEIGEQAVLGSLDIISSPFLTGLWVLALVALGYAIRSLCRSHRRSFLRGIGLSLTALLCVALASSDTVNAHYAYLPTAGDIRGTLTGDRQWLDASALTHLSPTQQRRARAVGVTVRLHLAEDPADGFGETTAIAYLPPQYFLQPSARFPVLYLFHGSPGRPADWFHGGDASRIARGQAAAGRPVIVVAPQLSRRWTDDPECVDGASEKVESHLLTRVIPAVDTRFRTVPGRQARIFAGMSAGGYCALNLGLRNRNTAATIIDMSGFTEPTHTGGVANLFRGNADPAALVVANTPATYAATLPAGPITRLWLDTGQDDKRILRQMSSLVPVLRARGVVVQWRVRAGGHTFWVWTAALRESLPWALGGPPGHSRRNPSHEGPSADHR